MTRVMRAKSGDWEFVQRIKNSRFHGFVHSVFDKAVNIQCLENDELYTIAYHGMDNGPNTLVVEGGNFQKMDIAVNDKVLVRTQGLCIADKIAITTDQPERWECLLPCFPEDTVTLQLNLAVMEDYLAVYGNCGGMKRGLPSGDLFQDEMSRLLHTRASLLVVEGLLSQSMSAAISHGVTLIGLGPGLTPSGDDFLVGLFAVLNIPGSPFFRCHGFCTEVAAKAQGLTNQISYMALKKAAIGQVRQSIVHLLYNSLYGKREDFLAALHEVINIGSCSGTDIAFGIQCGLELNLKFGR